MKRAKEGLTCRVGTPFSFQKKKKKANVLLHKTQGTSPTFAIVFIYKQPFNEIQNS